MKYQGHVSDPKDLVTKEYADQKYSATNTPPYPVRSVNGKTGDITVAAGISFYPGKETDDIIQCDAGYTGPFVMSRITDDPNGYTVVLKPNSAYCGYFSEDGSTGFYGFDEYNHNWSAICCGGGKAVAVASGEAVSICFNGYPWSDTIGTLPVSQRWGAICYGNGKFVAIQADKNYMTKTAAYSTNGVNWTSVTLPTPSAGDIFYSIAYGGGKFVITASSKRIYYSSDAVSWTQVTMSGSNIAAITKLFYVNGQFIGFSDRATSVMFSTDGKNWTGKAQEDGSVGYGNSERINYVNGFFINPFYSGSYGYIAFGFSQNGTYWQFEKVIMTTYRTSTMPNAFNSYADPVTGIMCLTSAANSVFCRVQIKSFIQDGKIVAKLKPLSIKLADNTTADALFVVGV